MAVRLDIFRVLQVPFLKRATEPMRVTLATDPAKYMSMRPTGQIIQILSGHAWITCNGKDILLDAGQQSRLPIGGDAVIISAIGPAGVTFEIRRNPGK